MQRSAEGGKSAAEQDNFLIFAGTTEGRELAEFLSRNEIPVTVCVATEYGREVVGDLPGVEVRSGRLEASEMEVLIRERSPIAVIDATHPYAAAVSENIRNAAGAAGVPLWRLLREGQDPDALPGVVSFPDPESAADWLQEQEGNILLTTGMKELPVFTGKIAEKGRIWARILLREDVFDQIAACGLVKKQVICMQGPFSKEMNMATLHMAGARFLVTKESGKAGGFMEKVEAAREVGALCVVIRRPVQESGFSPEEICAKVLEVSGKAGKNTVSCPDDPKRRTLTLVGIGMGGFDSLTLAAVRACKEADCLIGAPRVLETLTSFDKPSAALYRTEEIVSFLKEHEEYRRIAAVFSGDVGFYSGAKRLTELVQEDPVLHGIVLERICGVPTPVSLAAKLQIPWEDMALVSSHGREQNLIGAVRTNEKVFSLASYAESIREMAARLCEFGLGEVHMSVGCDLSYPTEQLYTGKAADFLDFDGAGLCAAVIENPAAPSAVVSPGIPDEQFIRGNVPMTKAEVRSVVLSKLRLSRDAVVWDIGAGTGSVSVECARLADRGMVYALERRGEGCELIRQNSRKFAVSNLRIVKGSAPEALGGLPAPTHVFVGGSGGALPQILDVVLQKNPAARILADAITVETFCEVIENAKRLEILTDDITCISAAKSKHVGSYHMMTGQNPVWLVVMQKER